MGPNKRLDLLGSMPYNYPKQEKLLRLKKKKNPKKLTPLKKGDEALLTTEEQEEETRIKKLEKGIKQLTKDVKAYVDKLSDSHTDHERRIEAIEDMNDDYKQTLKQYLKMQEQRNIEIDAQNEEMQAIQNSMQA